MRFGTVVALRTRSPAARIPPLTSRRYTLY
jgi:hypothetical protein